MEEQTFGSLETLKPGDVLIVSARKVNGGKIQLEFAEQINTTDRPVSLLAALNRDDDRFSSRARRSWMSVSAAIASEDFGFDFEDTNESWYVSDKGEVLDVNLLNPTWNDKRVRLSVQETIVPTTWQQENVETAAKRRGAGGEYITYKGDYIFSNTIVVATNDEVQHTYLESDAVKVEIESDGQITTESMVGELESDEIGL